MPEFIYGGIRHDYVAEGQGSPVLLIHSGGSNRRQWRAQLAALAPRYQAIAPDLAGHGRSDWPPRPLTIPEEAAAMIALLDQRALARVAVVAHSHSVMVTLALALDHPDRIGSLFLYEPGPYGLLQMGDAEARALMREQIALVERIRQATDADREGAFVAWLETLREPGTWAALAPEIRAEILARSAVFVRDFDSQTAYLPEPARLAALPTPALVVDGALSTRFMHVATDWLARLLPHARRERLPAAGHFAPVEQAAAFNACLLRWLEDVHQAGDNLSSPMLPC